MLRPTGFFQDENGKRSVTRFVLVVNTVTFVIAAMANVFGGAAVDSAVWGIIQTVYGFGIGGQVIRTSIKNAKTQQEFENK